MDKSLVKRTKTIEDNLNPLFYECLELTFEANTVEEMPPFILDVWDWDLTGDDYIARCLIPVKDSSYYEGDQV